MILLKRWIRSFHSLWLTMRWPISQVAYSVIKLPGIVLPGLRRVWLPSECAPCLVQMTVGRFVVSVFLCARSLFVEPMFTVWRCELVVSGGGRGCVPAGNGSSLMLVLPVPHSLWFYLLESLISVVKRLVSGATALGVSCCVSTMPWTYLAVLLANIHPGLVLN